MNVAVAERELYEKMWAVDAYANDSPGEIFAQAFIDMAHPERGASVLDAGCGSGKGALALEHLSLRPILCDLIDARIESAKHLPFTGGICLWNQFKEWAHWAYCCDVLEHVPTEFTMLVAQNVIGATVHGAFFSIALVPDNFGALVGTSLHKTVQPFTWWRDRLGELGEVVESRDLLTNGLYLVRPR